MKSLIYYTAFANLPQFASNLLNCQFSRNSSMLILGLKARCLLALNILRHCQQITTAQQMVNFIFFAKMSLCCAACSLGAPHHQGTLYFKEKKLLLSSILFTAISLAFSSQIGFILIFLSPAILTMTLQLPSLLSLTPLF